MRLRLALALVAVAWSACHCPDHPPAAPAKPKGNAEVVKPDESVHPVYGGVASPKPDAQRLCAALFDVPEDRSAACCKRSPLATLTGECVRTLSLALQAGAVSIDPTHLTACVQAETAAHQGCDWVGSQNSVVVPECGEGLFVGTLHAGARCRSTLECQAPLRCQNASPTTVGVCAAPKPARASCNTGVDVAAAYAGLDLESARPECEGYCDHHKCQSATPVGGACARSLTCGPAAHCAEGKCVAGSTAALGEACGGAECSGGTHCLDGHCRVLKPAGASCTSPFECQGACLTSVDGGTCGMRCLGDGLSFGARK